MWEDEDLAFRFIVLGSNNFVVVPNFATSMSKGLSCFISIAPDSERQSWLAYVFSSASKSITNFFLVVEWPRLGTLVVCNRVCSLLFFSGFHFGGKYCCYFANGVDFGEPLLGLWAIRTPAPSSNSKIGFRVRSSPIWWWQNAHAGITDVKVDEYARMWKRPQQE